MSGGIVSAEGPADGAVESDVSAGLQMPAERPSQSETLPSEKATGQIDPIPAAESQPANLIPGPAPTNDAGDYLWHGDTPAQWIMAISGVVATLLSGIALWFLWRNLVETRRMAEKAAETANAAILSSRSELESRLGNLQIEKMVLAPGGGLLHNQDPYRSLSERLRNDFIELHIRNRGASDARLLSIEYGYTYGELPPEPNYRFSQQLDDEITADAKNSNVIVLNIKFAEQDIERLITENPWDHFWIYGRITYRSHLGTKTAKRFGGCLEFCSDNLPERFDVKTGIGSARYEEIRILPIRSERYTFTEIILPELDADPI